MAERFDTMMNPPVEGLLDKTGSKFSLVTLAARRARQINTYYNQLGDALGTVVPPQVTSTARKGLSITFEEIDADKIEGVGGATGKPVPESLLAEQAAAEDGAFLFANDTDTEAISVTSIPEGVPVDGAGTRTDSED